VAPRPFVDEPLGSWLGRLAAGYRLGVYALADLYGIDLGERCRPWLLLTELSEVSLTKRKLAWLTRLDVHQVAGMQPPQTWCEGIRRLPYCPRCFFLNPVDVTSPRWTSAWLDPAVKTCPVHDTGLTALSVLAASKCRNFTSLISRISSREWERECRR
jgi:hypothetical protein